MLGGELRRARDEAGLTQEEAALRAGIDRSYLSQLENGRYSPTVDLLVRLCKALGVRPSEVLRRVEDSEVPTKP